ncbi:hypothetical protein [Burkholderia gladioli]|uniref:hypothetical protein n=1 Tax=Burkholderia gladioli TaxID=28095 RepID=UPI0010574498|nr:hypothetical protein [Burkholderia gladioli]
MNLATPRLYRAHSKKYLDGRTGIITNPNLLRARQPRDMPPAVHQVLDDWFFDRFGVKYRGSSLFCTGDATIAAGYVTEKSALISVEPLGNYSLSYSPICKDLFGHYQFYWSSPETTLEDIHNSMDSLGFIHQVNGEIQHAAATGHEVMLFGECFRYTLHP